MVVKVVRVKEFGQVHRENQILGSCLTHLAQVGVGESRKGNEDELGKPFWSAILHRAVPFGTGLFRLRTADLPLCPCCEEGPQVRE